MSAALVLLAALGVDPFFTLPVRRDAGVGTYHGRVELDSRPFTGATVTAVAPFNERADDVCGSGERPGCVCQPAWDFARQLERRELQPVVLARAVSGDGGVFTLDHLPERFGLWVDAPDAGARYIAQPDDQPLWLAPPVFTDGTVRDVLGPVEGATVSVITPQHRVFETVTDGGGHFSVGPLAGAPFWVFIRRAGYQPTAARLEKRPVLLGHPGTLEVLVRDQDGGVSAGVAVEAADPPRLCVARAVTDARGRATLEHLDNRGFGVGRFTVTGGEPLFGDAQLDVAASGSASLVLHPTAALSVDLAPPDGGRRRSDWASVRCPSRAAEDGTRGGHLALGQLEPGSCALDFDRTRRWVALDAGVATQVTLETTPAPEFPLEVRVLDPRGRPIHPRLWVRQDGDDAPGRHLDGWNGGVSSLRAGTWLVSVADDDLTSQPVKVTVPGTRQLMLHAVRSPPLTGVLREANGQPIAHADLDLSDTHAHPSTDAAGRFSVETRAAGRCELKTWLGTGNLHRALRFDVVLPRWAPLTLTAEPLLRTRGRLVMTTGEPASLAGVRLSRDGEPLTWAELTLADGGFDLALPPGTYTAQATLQGSRDVHITGIVTAGARNQRLVAEGPVRARGQLVDASGAPITDFTVNHQPMHDDAGTFEWPALPASTLWLTAGDAGTLRLEVPEHATDFGRLVVAPRSFQTLRVVGPRDEPLPDARLEAVSARWAAADHAAWPYCEPDPTSSRVDVHGVGMIAVAPAELIRVHAPGFPFVEVKPGEAVARLAPGSGAVHGRVLRNGAPLRNAEVCVTGNDRWQRLLTDVEGRFSARGLGEGPHAYYLVTDNEPGWLRMSAQGRFEVAAGQDVELKIALKPAP